MKVLIVDDSPAIRTKLGRYLSELGHSVVGEASNGFEAVEEFKRLKPDLVTMDIVMPECDGISALKEILKVTSGARVLMVTSAATDTNLIEAENSGALGYVVKPFVKATLKEALSELEKRVSRKAG